MLERYFPALRSRRQGEGSRRSDIFSMMEPFFMSSMTPGSSFGNIMPAMDVSETDEAVLVNVELPGIAPEDVDLQVENNYLIVRGEKKSEHEEKKENSVHKECSYGCFSRSIPIPTDIEADKVSAKFKNGVLKITLPKGEKAKTKRISIES
ncbi:Hsp20/alpha crystallin family protein [Desulfonatronum parangueonense]